ncbi:DNA repair protein RAD57 [Xylariomycetidae sp. FL2044]|nr:DNA repair protein RAD57 [Xylariomycetidae sp. FL2044]
MTDLSRILPDFPLGPYARLLPAIEKHQLTTTDLLTLEVADIGKRTQLPLLDVKRLCNAVLDALHADLGISSSSSSLSSVGNNHNKQPGGKQPQPRHQVQHQQQQQPEHQGQPNSSRLKQTGTQLMSKTPQRISTLDPLLDAALGGGIPVGYVTEITGESGAGKTQLLLTLLLSSQLSPAQGGLGRPSLYVSTEAPLSTRRLAQILTSHPRLNGALEDDDDDDECERPTLDGVLSTVTPDLESQDHILSYQVPVEVARRGVGLVVVDSVAANYRAEFESTTTRHSQGQGNGMARRGAELARLGRLLHDLARTYDLAVVVANQVADRFTREESSNYIIPSSIGGSGGGGNRTPNAYGGGGGGGARNTTTTTTTRLTQESPLAARSRARSGGMMMPASSSSASPTPSSRGLRSSMPEPPPMDPPAPAALLLDHQQRWFTGWGDVSPYHAPSSFNTLRHDLKTPSLGLVWSTQIASRIALFRRPVVYGRRAMASASASEQQHKGVRKGAAGWRRWMKVVFAPHVAGTGPGLEGAVEFEVTMGGIRGVQRNERKRKLEERGG